MGIVPSGEDVVASKAAPGADPDLVIGMSFVLDPPLPDLQRAVLSESGDADGGGPAGIRAAALGGGRTGQAVGPQQHLVAACDLRHQGGVSRFGEDPPGPLLIAAKHQSTWETFALLQLFSDPTFIIKRELMWIPLFGWCTWKAGMIPVDRGAGKAALTDMAQRARAALLEGRQIVIFPEGTRRAAGAEPKYKIGIAHLYAEGGRRACRSRSIPACSGRGENCCVIPARSSRDPRSDSTRARQGCVLRTAAGGHRNRECSTSRGGQTRIRRHAKLTPRRRPDA